MRFPRFSIFAGVSFTLQKHTIADTVRMLQGNDIVIWAPWQGDSPLNEAGKRCYSLISLCSRRGVSLLRLQE